MRGATRPNCQPLTLSHLEFDGGPTVSMPAAARPHCILPARNSETLTIFSNFERKHYVQVRRNYGRQPSNQLQGARGASGHACSTGLSTGRRLMPMTARCGAAAPCRGAATVRQLPTRGKWWEAAGCVELTERVQLQPHAKLVAIQTEACPAVRSTQPKYQPANALHVLLYKIHTVSRWKRLCNCLDCHEFSSVRDGLSGA